MLRRVKKLVRHHAGLLKGVVLALILLALILLLRTLPVEEPLEWLKARVDVMGAWGPIAFVILFVALTVILLPGWPLNVAAGVVFGPLAGGAISSVASTGSAAVSFAIGRLLAHRRIGRMVRSWLRCGCPMRCRSVCRTSSWASARSASVRTF
jgi:uncharacterized membrane protein YdjX (TVP38/TMEM64 family)